MSQTIPPAQLLPTTNVTMKDTGAEAVINASDFNPDLHDKPAPKTETPAKKAEKPAGKGRAALKDDEDDDGE